MNYKTEITQLEKMNKQFFEVKECPNILEDELQPARFWESLTESFLAFKLQKETAKLFIGAILTVPTSNGHLEILDGKKRMINIILLISAAKWFLSKHYAYDYNGIILALRTRIDLFLYGNDKSSRLSRPRIAFASENECNYIYSLCTGENFVGEVNTTIHLLQTTFDYYREAFEEANQEDIIAFIYYITTGIELLLITSKNTLIPERILSLLSGTLVFDLLKLLKDALSTGGKMELLKDLHLILNDVAHELLNSETEIQPLKFLATFLEDKFNLTLPFVDDSLPFPNVNLATQVYPEATLRA